MPSASAAFRQVRSLEIHHLPVQSIRLSRLISLHPARRLAAAAIVSLIAAGCDQRQVPVAVASPTDTISVENLDATRGRLASCWYIDPNKVQGNLPMVEIKTELLPDGTVKSVEIVDAQRMESDAAFREMATSARRAVLNC